MWIGGWSDLADFWLSSDGGRASRASQIHIINTAAGPPLLAVAGIILPEAAGRAVAEGFGAVALHCPVGYCPVGAVVE